MGEGFSKETPTDVSSSVEPGSFQFILEGIKSTSRESVENCEEPSGCNFSSLVGEVQKLEAYPYNSDGAMIFENLIAQLNELPPSIIDYMGMNYSNIFSFIQLSDDVSQPLIVGYVPNSMVRVPLGKWVQEFAKVS